MADAGTLLIEDNPVSLRTAIVLDNGDLVYFLLMPRSSDLSIPGAFNHGKSDATWLYRRKRSFFGERALKMGFFPVEQAVRPMVFDSPPELELRWTNFGQSVALLLNGEPWAFIHDEKNHGYSKGILKPTIGNPWDQELFEKIFGSKGHTCHGSWSD